MKHIVTISGEKESRNNNDVYDYLRVFPLNKDSYSLGSMPLANTGIKCGEQACLGRLPVPELESKIENHSRYTRNLNLNSFITRRPLLVSKYFNEPHGNIIYF